MVLGSEYAMVHGFTLLPYLLDTVQYPDGNFAVRESDTEKTAFGLPVLILALQLTTQAFFFGQCLFIFSFLYYIAVVVGS